MFITDWGNVLSSYMSYSQKCRAERERKLRANSTSGKRAGLLVRRSTPFIVRRTDDSEATTDDVTQEEIDAAKRWATMGRVHKAGAWKGQKK